MDHETGEIPGSMGHNLVATTPSCVAVGTLSDLDGETEVVLTDEQAYPKSDRDLRLAFTGTLMSSRKQVDVCTVDLRKIIGLAVAKVQCAVEVWVNDRKEPNKVCFVVT